MNTLQCKLSINLKPNAKHTRIVSVNDDGVVISVNSPPRDGKANDHLVRFLAQTLGIARSSVTITHGFTSRKKVVAIDGFSKTEVLEVFCRVVENG